MPRAHRQLAALASLTASLALAACSHSSPTLRTREGLVTMRGNPITLEGTSRGVTIGKPAPDFTAVGNDMREVALASFRGKTIILSTIPSLETPVCDAETRMFNERASALGEGVVVLTVSMDLPMTQKKW
mgnify:FL=1